MSPGTIAIAFAVVVGILAIAVPVYFYNRGVTLRNRCQESWSNVDTELLRRHALIPNLVEVVKAAARHERAVFAEVVEARAAAMAAPRDASHRNGPEVRVAQALDRLLAVAEAHPELQASKHFLELQEELALTEDRIQAARRFYNANVRDHRDLTQQFPGHLFARMYHFETIPFFEVESTHTTTPQVAL